MRRAVLGALLAGLCWSGCSSAEPQDPEAPGSNRGTIAAPDPVWGGPPIAAHNTLEGGMELTVVAPTANHGLELVGVEVVGGTADVTVHYVTPGAMFVAQVLSPVRMEVPANLLGEATRVRFWIATVPRDAAGEAPPAKLSLIQTRG